MKIQFERIRKLEISAWRKIFWDAWSARVAWGSFIVVLLLAAAINTGMPWLWGCAGIAIAVVGAIVGYIVSVPHGVVSRENGIVSLLADEEGVSIEFGDGTVRVGWEQIRGVNQFGNFWLFDCENGAVGTLLIPVDAVNEEIVKSWTVRICGKTESKP